MTSHVRQAGSLPGTPEAKTERGTRNPIQETCKRALALYGVHVDGFPVAIPRFEIVAAIAVITGLILFYKFPWLMPLH